ncbi:hypothetical protein ACHAW5_009148 [Stephanodiscus triporus]|uniref:Band 7 domain-containing protein n=1 Tax=Stephanodiscus triporus TaxID=2934178 RepID=A0ABD3MVZ2_9STRA
MNLPEQHRHSKLVQRRISSAAEADRAFARVEVNSHGVTEIPIVLIPRSTIFRFAINVPSGPFVLWQKWHKNMGQLQPGVKWIWPGWFMVDIDLSISFRIGPGPDEATNFVYKLGADRFDELVAAEMEETVRSLAYSTTHDKISDMRDELSAGLLSTLNTKVVHYGVQVVTVKITALTLPSDIRDRLERIAALKAEMSEREKIHENRLRELEDEAARSIEATRKSNERKLQEIEAERIRCAIERRMMEESARGKARVEEMKAMTDADVALKKSLGNETVEKVAARQQAEARMKKTHIQCQTMRIEAEKNANIEVKKSEAEVAIAQSKAAAMIIRAEAESEGADAMKEKRMYELESEKMKVLEAFAASRSQKLVTGDDDPILSALDLRP